MIEIVNLCKSFGEHRVLDNLNLTIEKAETMVIIGRSGCGKSVLLKHIIGLMKPERGNVLVEGADIAKLSGKGLDGVRMRFGMLFQGAALFDSLTVGENVGFSLKEHNLAGEEEVKERVAEALSLVGLEGSENLMPAQLSGGMKKRVGLARAICMRPEIILYDEPTTGIDPIMADAINNLIAKLQRELKTTAVAVTHDMKSAYQIADRIAMLYKGKIIEVGTTAEIRNTENPVVRQFITGSSIGPITREVEDG